LTARSFEVRLDLLDSSFEFEIVKLCKARNVGLRINDFSRLSILPPRPATIAAEKAIQSILAYYIQYQGRRGDVTIGRWGDENVAAPRGEY
jgi:hypothetical protein